MTGQAEAFAGSATYRNADRDKIKLGVFRGYRSGIDVLMRRDIGDHLADSAEDAFYDALKGLKKSCPRQSTTIDRIENRKAAEDPG